MEVIQLRIVIDMQGAQTDSRFRGIGRYTVGIAKAIARNRGKHEVLLALSSFEPETIDTRFSLLQSSPSSFIKVA